MLLQVTPSQDVPQGSSDSSQLGGVFSHWSFNDRSIVAAINQRLDLFMKTKQPELNTFNAEHKLTSKNLQKEQPILKLKRILL